MHLLLRQEGQKPAERSQDGEPGIPAIAVPGTEQRGLPYHIRGWLARRQLTVHRLGDDQAEVMSETVREPLTPMSNRVAVAEHRFDPDLAAGPDLDRTSRHVVCP